MVKQMTVIDIFAPLLTEMAKQMMVIDIFALLLTDGKADASD